MNHAKIIPDKNGLNTFIYDSEFKFERGGSISPLVLAYETYGQLSREKNNVIVIHHALSTNSHVASHDKNPHAGWWENMVGPQRAIDTEKYFVICINNLGSCFGSSGPASINPTTQKPYRSDFPIITMKDIVHAQYLLLQHLGIHHVYAVLGNSMGAMLSLTWAILYPDSLDFLVLTSSCYKAYPANIANRVVQREIIQLDPAWQKGYYETNPIDGLKIARKLGHFTYRNPKTLNEKFLRNDKNDPNKMCEVENYLEYNANKFVQGFDTNSYLYLMAAMDLFDVTRGYQPAHAAFEKIKAKVLVISVDSDILFTPEQQSELYQQLITAGVETQFILHHSNYGHDTFLVETEIFGQYIKDFIE